MQGPCAELWIITASCQPVGGIIMQAQADSAIGKPCLQSGKLDADNGTHMRRCQPVKQQGFVKPVQKFRTEGGLHIRHNRITRCITVLTIIKREQMVCPDIRGQQDNGIGKIDTAAMTISQVTFIQHLKQNVENIGMRLLDLVKQHDLIGTPSHSFGQRAAFFITDIAGRRPDQTCHRMLFHIFRHINAQHRAVIIEQEAGERLCHFGLANAGRAQHQKAAHGLVRVRKAGT